MKKFEYVIKDTMGIHARPAGMLVREVKKYVSRIEICKGNRKTEASRLMALMSMGIKYGQKVTVEIEGEDEELAYEKMKMFFAKNL